MKKIVRVIVLVAVYVMSACSGTGGGESALDVQLLSLKKTGATDLFQQFEWTIRLSNHSDEKHTYHYGLIDLNLEGYRFIREARISSPARESIVLEPHQTVDFSLTTNTPLKDSVRLFNALASKKKQQLVFLLKVNLYKNKWRPVQLEREGKINLAR